MTLFQHQTNFIKNISDFLTRFRKIVAQLATGGGKTVIFSGICHKYLKRNNPPGILPGSGKTVVILVHRIELLKQTRKTCYNAFGIVCQPITAGMKFIPPGDVYIGMVETVYRLLKKRGAKVFGDVGILIIDEAHRLEFMKIHNYFPTQYIIGFSATPQTSSKKRPMNVFYDDIVCGMDIPELIQKGYLCQNITYAPENTVDREGLSMQKGAVIRGEFNDKIVGAEFSKARYVNSTVAAYKKYAEGDKALIFNVNIEHSQRVNDAFVAAGYDSRHLDSTMSDRNRDKILHWFKVTPGAVLNNVGITTTGFDEPTVQTIIVNKLTLSMSLFIQMAGRGSRPTPEKSMFRIIDMGKNWESHGDWCQSRDWIDLFHHPDKPVKGAVAPVKVCPNCDGIIYASAKKCPLKKPNGELCGYEFPVSSISIESELHDFIVVTKGIDVEKVIEDNKLKAESYAFFKIGKDLAYHAKNHVDFMTDEKAQFILDKYIELGREWMKQKNAITGRRKSFNDWWKITAKTNLFELLMQYFPTWETRLFKKAEVVDILAAQDSIHNAPTSNMVPPPTSVLPPLPPSVMPSINKIEALKNMHYEL